MISQETLFLPYSVRDKGMPGGGGRGHGSGWAGLSAHPLGQCLSDCVSLSKRKEQVTLEDCEREALCPNNLCILAGGLWGFADGFCHPGQRKTLSRDRPQVKGSEDPLGRLSPQKPMSLNPQRCEGRAGVRDVRPRDRRGRAAPSCQERTWKAHREPKGAQGDLRGWDLRLRQQEPGW